MREFDSTFPLDKPIDEAAPFALSTIGTGIARWNYNVASQTTNAIVFTRTYRRWPVWVLVVILFPIGLLFLFARSTAVITFSFVPRDDRTEVRVSGDAPRPLRRYFDELRATEIAPAARAVREGHAGG